MIIKILFSSAQTLHWPWLPILISVLFHPGLFLVLGRSFFYTQGVFGLDRDILELVYTFYTQEITKKDTCALIRPVASKYQKEHTPVDCSDILQHLIFIFSKRGFAARE